MFGGFTAKFCPSRLAKGNKDRDHCKRINGRSQKKRERGKSLTLQKALTHIPSSMRVLLEGPVLWCRDNGYVVGAEFFLRFAHLSLVTRAWQRPAQADLPDKESLFIRISPANISFLIQFRLKAERGPKLRCSQFAVPVV